MKSIENKNKITGSALGPDWSLDLQIKGAGEVFLLFKVKIPFFKVLFFRRLVKWLSNIKLKLKEL